MKKIKENIVYILCFLFIILSMIKSCSSKNIEPRLLSNMITNVKLINNYNSSLDEINDNDDKEEFFKLKNEVNNIKDSKYKQILVNKINLLDKYFNDYDRKQNLINNNPDKFPGLTKYINDIDVKEILNGNITAFTPYCGGGCNGYTSSGVFVGNNIFYDDKEYGKVRIVAGDSSYPFGTIVRIKGLYYFNEDVYAIVLDRGPAVGKNKRALFDLLFFSENNANDFGVQKNIKCEVLRIGY